MKGKNHIFFNLGPHLSILWLKSGELFKLGVTENKYIASSFERCIGKLRSSWVMFDLDVPEFQRGKFFNFSNK